MRAMGLAGAFMLAAAHILMPGQSAPAQEDAEAGQTLWSEAEQAQQQKQLAAALEKLVVEGINTERKWQYADRIAAFVINENPEFAADGISGLERMLHNSETVTWWSAIIGAMADIGAAHPEHTQRIYAIAAEHYAVFKTMLSGENFRLQEEAIDSISRIASRMPGFRTDAIESLTAMLEAIDEEDAHRLSVRVNEALTELGRNSQETAAQIVTALEPYLEGAAPYIKARAARTIGAMAALHENLAARGLELLRPLLLEEAPALAESSGLAGIIDSVALIGSYQMDAAEESLDMLAAFLRQDIEGGYKGMAIDEMETISRHIRGQAETAVMHLKELAQSGQMELRAARAIRDIGERIGNEQFIQDARDILAPLTREAGDRAVGAAAELAAHYADSAEEALEVLNIFREMVERDVSFVTEYDFYHQTSIMSAAVKIAERYPQYIDTAKAFMKDAAGQYIDELYGYGLEGMGKKLNRLNGAYHEFMKPQPAGPAPAVPGAFP